jgi:endonuclease G
MMKMKKYSFILLMMAAMLLPSCGNARTHKPLMGGVLPAETRSAATNDESAATAVSAGDFWLPAKLTGVPEQILQRTGYVVSYNRTNRLPNWVAWHLTASHTTGSYKRNGIKFHEDEDVPTPRATHFDYMSSGYDRGHMCPSGDNKWSEQAQEESFLMTNMCPQVHNLNAGDWNEMEGQCRKWAKEYGDIYIVCGPILYRTKHKTIGQDKVVVPEAFFKVVLRMGSNPRAIGFIYKNQEGNRPKGDYVNSIAQIERITGIQFFSGMSAKQKQSLEKNVNLSDWGL